MKIQFLLVWMAAMFLVMSSCKSQTENPTVEGNTATEVPANISKDITVTESKVMMDANNPNLVVLDIRTQEEINQGMISGAQHLDFYSDDFKSKVAAMDMDKEYLVYCRSGGRSAKAMKMMSEAGFKTVYNMLGGYTKWTKEQ